MCCRLRDLLSFEDALYGQQMVAAEETILERQAKMRERAKKLKEDREAERLGVVHKKYEEQWRCVPRLPQLTVHQVLTLTSPHVYFSLFLLHHCLILTVARPSGTVLLCW